MPFLMPIGTASNNVTIISPAIIGEGPPTTGTPEDSGRFYIDSLTNVSYINIYGTWKEVVQVGEPGPPGQPRFIGGGPPPETVPASTEGGPVPGDLYLNAHNGDVYQMDGDTSGFVSIFGARWT